MIPYQRLICSATTLLPLKSWLQYEAKFHTLATANPLLRWDQRHPDLWLECLALGNKEQQRWPCPYCKATTHFPENCPQSPFRHNKSTPTPPEPGRFLPPICSEFNQGGCTRATCKYRHLPVLSRQPPSNQLPQKPEQAYQVMITLRPHDHLTSSVITLTDNCIFTAGHKAH